ncbi:MAG: hypothetical protein P8Q39_05190, partial [Candidatus Thalassarchaeaceae archaeon]|nr:hypothetical protein [Candidatus Thalassarchaeaceae archaeon]
MNNKTWTAIILVLVMILVPWTSMLNGSELDEDSRPAWATGSSTSAADTGMNLSNPNTTHGSDANLNLTNVSGMESVLLFSFPMTSPSGPIPSAGSIQSATLTLYITGGMSQGSMYAFAAPLKADFDEGNATWFNNTHNSTWQVGGANGTNDRGSWEPRSNSFSSSSSSFSINVTSIAQRALANNNGDVNVTVSSVGLGILTVASREHPTTAKRPSMSFVYDSTPPTSGSAIVRGGPDNDSVPITGSFLLTADTTPTLGWSGLNGSGVEIHISQSNDFRSIDDDSWLFSSWGNSGFTMSGGNGTFTIPSSTSLDLGMAAYWRIRASKGDQLSEWQTGQFLLPFINATNNGNNTATFELLRDSLGVDGGTIHDAWLRSGSSNVSGGDTDNMWIGNSNNTSRDDMAALMHVDLDHTGLHSNATILSAYMQMRRTDRQGDAWISIHEFSQTNWSEDTASWDNYSGNQSWPNGGLSNNIGPSLDIING